MISKLAYVHPDAKIGNNVTVEPFACIAGDVVIGDDCWVGPGAVIHDGARIGKGCKIHTAASVSCLPQDLKFAGEVTTAEIGDYNDIREYVTISRGTASTGTTRIGNRNLLMAYVHVGHDCVVGDNCVIANRVSLAGEVHVGNWVVIGGHAAVHQWTHIGDHVMIQGGALLGQDVPPFIIVRNDTMRFAGINKIGLSRRGFTPERIAEIHDACRLLYQSGLNYMSGCEEVEKQIPQSAERDELTKQIAYLKEVLENVGMQMQIIKDELLEIKEKYGDERRSEIVFSSEDYSPEDFYADDDMVITISHMGYIKRTPLAEYRTQNRGGVGAKGSAARDEDFIEHIYVASMHNTMLFFTEKGRCFWLKVYEIPEGARSSKGRAIQNVIQIEPDDKVRAYINVKRLNDEEYVNNNFIIMCTKDGTIKKTKLEAYSRPRQNGVNAIVIREGDQLIEAKLTSGQAEVMIAARDGKAIRFNESTVRPIGRVGAGVRGISIEESDEVVGMICVEPDSKQWVRHTYRSGRNPLYQPRRQGCEDDQCNGENRQTYLHSGRYGRQRPDDYQPFGTYHTYGSVADPPCGPRDAGRAYHQPARGRRHCFGDGRAGSGR